MQALFDKRRVCHSRRWTRRWIPNTLRLSFPKRCLNSLQRSGGMTIRKSHPEEEVQTLFSFSSTRSARRSKPPCRLRRRRSRRTGRQRGKFAEAAGRRAGVVRPKQNFPACGGAVCRKIQTVAFPECAEASGAVKVTATCISTIPRKPRGACYEKALERERQVFLSAWMGLGASGSSGVESS